MGPDGERTRGELSECLSAAAADPAVWPEFLGRLATAVGSNSVGLHREQFDSSGRGRLAFKYGFTNEFKAAYERSYGPRNPVLHSGYSFEPCRSYFREEVCSDEIFLSSEFYDDFLKPHDLFRLFGAIVAPHENAAWVISITGSHQRDTFSTADARLLSALLPQLHTALLLQDRLGMAETRL